MNDVRLLIIDDEEIIISVLRDFFTDMGFAVSSASSGKTGLEILSANDFDAVIVDMRLPDMSGNELLEKAIGLNCRPVYFVHTGSIDYELPQSLRKAGITEENIIFKPITDLFGLLTILKEKIGARDK